MMEAVNGHAMVDGIRLCRSLVGIPVMLFLVFRSPEMLETTYPPAFLFALFRRIPGGFLLVAQFAPFVGMRTNDKLG